jgi:hypothetical protein
VVGVLEFITWTLYDYEELYDVVITFKDGILRGIRVDKGCCSFYVEYDMDRGWIGEAQVMGVAVRFTASEEDIDALMHRIRRELLSTPLMREDYSVW